MANDAQITQATVEAVFAENDSAAAVTQASADALFGENEATAAITHAYVDVVILADIDEDNPPSLVSQTIYSSVDLPDPSSYYLGFKDGRVLSFGTATRTLSDLAGQWSANDLSCTLADTDRSVRQVLQLAKGLRETPAIVRMIADSDRRALGTPTVVFRGALRAWRPRGDLAVELEYTDAVGLKLARRGTDRQLPTRSVLTTDFPTAPSTSQAKPIPIVYGAHRWWTGACPLLYVGTVNLGDGAMHTWVVAGHACKAVPNLYLDGVETDYGTQWRVPGHTNWPLATLYYDVNGRRYTVLQGVGPDPDAAASGSKALTCNVDGVESMGDGTGSLTTQSFLQYLHFFRHFVLDDYQGGVWPETPLEWEAGWCQINAQSFVDAQTESKRWVSGSGYAGQAYIGPERRSVRDWLATWNTSLNCRLGLNRYHQWAVVVMPGAMTTEEIAALPSISDAQDVLRGSFSLEALNDEAITRATVSAYALPKESGTVGASETYVDRQAETDSDTEIGATLALDFLAATPQTAGPLPTSLAESAEDVTKRWIGFRSGAPIYRVTFDAGLCAWEAVDVGDLFRMTHFAGTTVAGWTNRILWCESVALDIDQRIVTFTALDVTHAYEGARTLENLVDPVDPENPEDPVEPVIEGERPIAPTGGSGALVDAALGSTRYGTPNTTVYFKVVAVFDSGEESKPLILGPFTTGANGGDQFDKRVNIKWNAYPTGAQTGIGGGSVTPTAMRIYRCPDSAFLANVVKCDLTGYPVPEAPGNLTLDSEYPGGTTLYYAVSHYYYLVGEGPKSDIETTTVGAQTLVDIDFWDDPHIDQVGEIGIFESAVYGRSDSDADAYLDNGLMGWYVDDGSDIEKGGSPWAAVTPGADLPLTATSFYDMWPGKANEANNPWESV